MSFHKNGAILLRLLDGLLFRRPVTRLGPRHDRLVSRRLSVGCLFKVTEPSSIPAYRTHSTCAKRAMYPDPPPVIRVPLPDCRDLASGPCSTFVTKLYKAVRFFGLTPKMRLVKIVQKAELQTPRLDSGLETTLSLEPKRCKGSHVRYSSNRNFFKIEGRLKKSS